MSNEKQQTAVEWLVNHWKKLQLEGEKMSWQQIIDITELAKEMEKQQIMDAVNEGIKQGYTDYIDTEWGRDNDYNPEQYYNETYGGNK